MCKEKATGKIKIEVFTVDYTPISGVMVTLYLTDPKTAFSHSIAGEDGVAIFEKIPTGIYSIE